jgi:DNA-binding PadR family transcriptional regulator
MLHALERRGYLRSSRKLFGRSYRRLYRITPAGRKALALARARLRELFREVIAAER